MRSTLGGMIKKVRCINGSRLNPGIEALAPSFEEVSWEPDVWPTPTQTPSEVYRILIARVIGDVEQREPDSEIGLVVQETAGRLERLGLWRQRLDEREGLLNARQLSTTTKSQVTLYGLLAVSYRLWGLDGQISDTKDCFIADETRSSTHVMDSEKDQQRWGRQDALPEPPAEHPGHSTSSKVEHKSDGPSRLVYRHRIV
ncbi:hypothetical protein PTI98_007410 [Pleurotus ostreatus]|nr:hypothetical protein PTI98_007410 [Pleurotus ostreatus]